MLRRLIFSLVYLEIERTNFYLLEKVTFLSQSLLMLTVNLYSLIVPLLRDSNGKAAFIIKITNIRHA